MKEGESHDKNADGKVRGNDVYFQDSVVHGGAFPHRRRNVTAFRIRHIWKPRCVFLFPSHGLAGSSKESPGVG